MPQVRDRFSNVLQLEAEVRRPEFGSLDASGCNSPKALRLARKRQLVVGSWRIGVYRSGGLQGRSGAADLGDLPDTRVRYDYKRVHVLLRREEWLINMKKTRIATIVDTHSRFSPATDPRFSFRGEDLVPETAHLSELAHLNHNKREWNSFFNVAIAHAVLGRSHTRRAPNYNQWNTE